jgi:hypothetical protein
MSRRDQGPLSQERMEALVHHGSTNFPTERLPEPIPI